LLSLQAFLVGKLSKLPPFTVGDINVSVSSSWYRSHHRLAQKRHLGEGQPKAGNQRISPPLLRYKALKEKGTSELISPKLLMLSNLLAIDPRSNTYCFQFSWLHMVQHQFWVINSHHSGRANNLSSQKNQVEIAVIFYLDHCWFSLLPPSLPGQSTHIAI